MPKTFEYARLRGEPALTGSGTLRTIAERIAPCEGLRYS
ncbi:hypothetical protein KL86DES1_20349 [uncultured Desulfovibrio sp.]|uniref:Uncharacterized protein n=1 Tax=uncultured Desulfovibrio sp. TaxID=167968 RepID=A0A212L383_9BACT|nr:hypothetical protein KL86DES1_20349 [uncultured Desulfovibrio sp.]VZH33251.1 conserved protein of unknown function [Desulfovibrio sp. 86]